MGAHTSVALLQRLRLGEERVQKLDALALADLAEGMLRGEKAENILDLPHGWAEHQRLRARDEAIAAARREQVSARAAARDLRQRIERYAATGYRRDREAGRADRPENAELYRILTANGDRVPGLTTLRKIFQR
jgi:hypothetical protein